MLPELIELSRDESGSVRLAAFETLVNMLDMFDTGKSACAGIFISERLFSMFYITNKEQRLIQIVLFSLEFYDFFFLFDVIHASTLTLMVSSAAVCLILLTCVFQT